MKFSMGSGYVFTAMLLLTSACHAGDGDPGGEFKAGIRLSESATATDVGLPAYPGSRPSTDPHESSSAAKVGISTPLFGFRIAAVKLETADEPERVAAFYRQALSKYGKVLECGAGRDEQEPVKSGDGLECDSEPEAHKVVYKAGTRKNHRIVAIESHGNGTRFDLVCLNVRGD